VAYVQVKNLLQTWKLAAFLVAFFSSFFVYSTDINYDALEAHGPQSTPEETGVCSLPTGDVSDVKPGECHTMLDDHFQGILSATKYNIQLVSSSPVYQDSTSYVWPFNYTFQNSAWIGTIEEGLIRGTNYGNFSIGAIGIEITKACPNDVYPEFTFGRDTDGDGEVDLCYNPQHIKDQIQDALDAEADLEQNEKYCKELVLDSGNNTSSTACYTAYNGAQCSVSKVTTSGGDSYYKGTGNESLGCGSSEDPPYDSSGTGDDKDGCIYSGGKNYCQANKDKHCKSISGTEICDDGCISDGSTIMCDTSMHDDVGEGDSDSSNTNGTCSVIAASGSKGFCEDMGGSWDDSQDYVETSCPTGTGTCSVNTGGHCAACFDAGGVWTPDSTQTPLTSEDRNSFELASIAKQGNLKQSETINTISRGNESIISTMKSGDGKVVTAIEALTKITKDQANEAAEKEEERETFTTTTADIDKSKITALFDDASKATLQAEIVQLQADTTTFINQAKSEALTLMSITAPSSTGYQARNLVMTQGTFDLSFSRFGNFFSLLAGPVMLLCSVIAAFILLGGKD
jgi:hypothetical protein